MPLVWGSHISGFPLSECPSAHSCLTSVSVLSCFASSLHLLQLFRCYLGIVTGWNNASSCFGCFMASFVITLCNQQGFFFFFTSEWQVKAKGLLVWWLNESLCIFFKPFPLHVVTNRKQAEVGPPDDRGEVRGSQGALGLQEQQQTERKPPSASQRQERPQRSVYDVIAVHWHHCEPKRCSMCSGFFLQVTALNAKIFLKARSVWFVLTCDSRCEFALLDVSVCCRMCSC